MQKNAIPVISKGNLFSSILGASAVTLFPACVSISRFRLRVEIVGKLQIARTLAQNLRAEIHFSKRRAVSIMRLKPVMESYCVRSRDYCIISGT